MHIEIEPIFESELAQPVQIAGSKIKHEKGAKLVLSHKLDTMTFGSLMIIAQSPCHLLLNEACRLADEVAALKAEIASTPQKQVFTSSPDPEMTAERALQEDPNAEVVTIVPKELAYRFFQSAMSFHFALLAAVEVFCTQAIPSQHVLHRTVKPRGILQKIMAFFGKNYTEKLTKVEIEHRLSTVEKLEVLADIKDQSSIKQEAFWGTFMKAKKLRDAVVHQKNGGVSISGYEPLYVRLLDADYEASVKAVVELVNKFAARPIILK